MSSTPLLVSPSALEVLTLIAAFLEEELMPAQTDSKLRFRARVAAELLRSAARELDDSSRLPRDTDGYAIPRSLAERGESLRQWVEELRDGRRMLSDESVYEAALELVRAKLAVVTGGDRNATS
ncbi:MAG TPA: hypothetical protein VMT29_10780 [Steroidobacteraceae bacterium]|nr:hypothetical protein [Steroidobacteraceae bacterium]